MAVTTSGYQIDVAVNGSSIEPSAAALVKLETNLSAAAKAAEEAGSAVTKANTAYEAAQKAVENASKGLERVNVALEEQRKKQQAAPQMSKEYRKATDAIAKLTERQKEAQEKASAAAQALDREGKALDALKKNAEAAKKKLEEMTGTKDRMTGTGDVNKLEKSFGKVGGAVGALGKSVFGAADDFMDLSESAGSTVAVMSFATAGTMAAVAAVLALGAAVATTVFGVSKWGVGLTDAARSNRLLVDGIAGTVDGGEQLSATVDKLQRSVPIAREELLKMASDLVKSGKSGDELQQALEDVATKAAKTKYGPDFAKQMISLEFLSSRLQTNIGKLFSGLKIDGLLEGLSKMVDLFDANSASGKAMKTIFESLVQPMIDAAVKAIPLAIEAFVKLEIFVLKAILAIKPYGSTIMLIAESMAVAAAAGAAFGAVVVAAAAAVTVALAAPFAITIALAQAFKSLVGTIASTNLAEVGKNVVAGLAQGITEGTGMVVSAIQNVAKSTVSAAVNAFKIGSPSKLMDEAIGVHLPSGIAQGVDRGIPQVEDSISRTAGAAVGAVSEPSNPESASPSRGSKSGEINLSGNTFHLYGVKDGEHAAHVMIDGLVKFFEGQASSLGMEVPA